MNLDPLVVLRSGEDVLWLAGPEHATRSDGSSSLMVAVAYGSTADVPEGVSFTDELGARWCAAGGVKKGFHIEGVILEEEEFYGRDS